MATPDAVALIQRRSSLLARLRATTAAAVVRAWDSLDTHDEAAQATFARRAGPVIVAGQQRSIAMTAAHLAALTGVRAEVDTTTVLAASAVDLAEPFIALGRLINAGADIAAALDAGRGRADAIADFGVQDASWKASAPWDDHVVGWRRVLDGKACDWCQLVSTQRYRTADSASFGHKRCGCTVDPIIGDSDPGRVINRELLASLKAS